MRKSDLKSPIQEGLGELASRAEMDHEVQMARAELYKIAKYAIKLHEMLKGVSEAEGLEGWVQSKITKAADYIGSVYHHLDYETQFPEEDATAVMSAATESSYIDSLKKRLEEKKKENNPYAIGMAQAMKSTGDEPPLKKSTIKKAHEIARKVGDN